MEHLANVVDRIRTIEARVQPDMPAGGFQQALARVAEPAAAAMPAAGSMQSFGAGATTSGPAGVTLAQMLGRPLSQSAPSGFPAGPAGLAGAAGVTNSAGTAGSAGVATSGSLHLPVDARVSSVFGPRIHPVTGQNRPHNGIDLAAPTGTPIGAAAGGTVSFAGVRGGYGNLVIVDHGDGTETRYAHQDTIAVTAGQKVAAGDVLGTVGSTGQSTGPHLHFEFRRDGTAVDPAPLLGLS